MDRSRQRNRFYPLDVVDKLEEDLVCILEVFHYPLKTSVENKAECFRQIYAPREVKLTAGVAVPKVEAWLAKKAADGRNNSCPPENAGVRSGKIRRLRCCPDVP